MLTYGIPRAGSPDLLEGMSLSVGVEAISVRTRATSHAPELVAGAAIAATSPRVQNSEAQIGTLRIILRIAYPSAVKNLSRVTVASIAGSAPTSLRASKIAGFHAPVR